MSEQGTGAATPASLPTSGAGGERPPKGLLRERFDAAKDTVIDNAVGKGESWSKKVGYGNQGVMLDDIPKFLGALGLKLVDARRICISPEQVAEYEAYKVIARNHLSPPAPALEQDWERP